MNLIAPGGFVNDPQVGRDNKLRSFDMGRGDSKEFTQEVRLFSGYDGPWNFSVGGIYTKFQSVTDYACSRTADRVRPAERPGRHPERLPVLCRPELPAVG